MLVQDSHEKVHVISHFPSTKAWVPRHALQIARDSHNLHPARQLAHIPIEGKKEISHFEQLVSEVHIRQFGAHFTSTPDSIK
jgi:hypothetical protein